MKRKITFLIAAMLLLTMITQPTRVWGQSRAAVFTETFNSCDGTGGNDGDWSGSIASGTLTTDNSGWSLSNGAGADKCAKFGASNKKGSAETPSITVSGGSRLTLTFKAGAWSGDQTQLNLSSTNCTLKQNGTAITNVTMTNGAWTTYTVDIEVNDNVSYIKIKFEGKQASKARFFLDEVVVTPKHTVTYAVSPSASGSVSGVVYGTSTAVASGSYITEGGKVTLTAEPASGYQFSAWSDGGNNSTLSSTSTNPTTFTMGTSNVTITATFVEAGNYITISPTTKNVDAEGGDQEFTIDTDKTISTTANEAVQFYSDSEGTVTTDKPSWISSTAYSTATNKLTVTVAANHTTTANGPAYFRAKNDDGSVTSEVVTISQDAFSVETPQISPTSGSVMYNSGTVTISCETADADIYYTLDGSTPTNESTLYTAGGFTINASKTVNAIAIKYGVSSEVATSTYTVVYPYTSIIDLYNDATSTSTSVYVTFNEWVIVAKTTDNAYVTDGHYGLNIYKSSHGFVSGKKISGTVQCNLITYQGGAELTGSNLTASNAAFTIQDASTPTAYSISLADIDAKYFGSYVDLGVLTYNGNNFTDGSNTITPYKLEVNLPSLKNNQTYRVKGVYTKTSNATRISPIANTDITEYNEPSVTTSPVAASAFNYIVGGGPSEDQMFEVTGSNLTSDDITVSVPQDCAFEITDNTDYGHSITIGSGDMFAVHMKANQEVGNYNATLTISNDGADDVEISLTGSVSYAHVTYNGNGEGVTNVPTDNTDYTYNQEVTVLGPGSMTRTGYTFDSWNTEEEGTGTERTEDDVFNITEDVTLYAQWTVNTHTLTLPAADAYGTYTANKTSPVAYGTKVTLTYTPEEGYEDYIAQWSSNDVTIASDGTFTMPDQNVTVTVTVIPNPYTKDVINRAFTGVTSTSYTSWNNKTGTSGAVYAGITTTNSNNNLQMNSGSNRGIITTTSGGKIKQLTVSWYSDPTDNRSITVYGKNTAYTATSDLYDNDKKGTSLGTLTKTNKTLIVSGDYTYVGLYASGAIYINEIDLFWEYVLPVDEGSLTQNTTIPANATVNETNLTIPNNKILTINGTLNVSGTFTNNGDATNIIVNDGGQLILPDNATVAATMKKTTSASTEETKDAAVNKWYAISTPVSGVAISSFIPTAVGAKWNVYRYDEPTGYWNEYRSDNTVEPYLEPFSTLDSGRGYLYRATENNLAFAGNVNAGDENGEVKYDLSYAYAGSTTDFKGFNLLGNPFTHEITWSNLVTTNVEDAGYYLLIEEEGENQGKWSANPLKTAIAPMQAFLVQANNTDAKVTIKNTTAKGGEEKSYNDNIMFTVMNGQQSDEAYVYFKEGHGLNKIDHRNAEIPMLYVVNNGEKFAIADMNADTKVINLGFEAKYIAKYTLSLKANGNFSYLHLIDKLTGEDVDMLLEGEYSFMAAPSDNAERFIVRLEYSEGSESSEVFAYQNGSDIIVSGEGELHVFDVMGRLVMQKNINGVERINAEAQGVYIFKLNEKTQKIVVR